jgi:N-acetylneuraminate synthase
MLDYIASKGKPVLLATGASSKEDVMRAMKVLTEKNIPICLMQCNTNYTTDQDKVRYSNLNVLDLYALDYPNILLGLSDHTPGFTTVLGAIAKGARIIEKHFTDDNTLDGPDHKFAMNPSSWKQMVQLGNELFTSLGDGIKKIEKNEESSIIVQQRCLRTTKRLPKGHVLTLDDIIELRPKPIDALEPYKIDQILGGILIADMEEGEHFTDLKLKN